MYINDLFDSFNFIVRFFVDDVLLYGIICCDEDIVDF